MRGGYSRFPSSAILAPYGDYAAAARHFHRVVEDCAALPMVRFQGGATVRASFIADRYPAVAAGTAEHLQTFYNFNSTNPSFAVSGGVWGNRSGGFFGGATATYTVSNLVGY